MPEHPRKRKRRSRAVPSLDSTLTPAERIERARARTLQQRREFFSIPEPQQPEHEDLSVEELQLATILRLHAEPGSCPPPYLLFAAHEDVLSEDHTNAIRDHAEDCALCSTLLTELAPPPGSLTLEAEARVRAHIPAAAFTGEVLPTLKPLPPLSRIILLPLLGFVAVVTLIVVAVVHFHNSTPSAPMPQAATAAAPPAALDAPELHHISPLAPPTDLPTVPTTGDNGQPTPTVSDLQPAFLPYNHGDYALAADQFRGLVTTFPSSEVPSLYLGVSELQLDQNAPAQHALDQAHQLATLKRVPEIDWYLAVADLRVGLRSEALPLLQALCAMTQDPHRNRACALSSQIESSQ